MAIRNSFAIDSFDVNFVSKLDKNHTELSVKCKHCYTDALREMKALEQLKLNRVVISKPLLGIICNLPVNSSKLDIVQFLTESKFHEIPDFMMDIKQLLNTINLEFKGLTEGDCQFNRILRCFISCCELKTVYSAKMKQTTSYTVETLGELDSLISTIKSFFFGNLVDLCYSCDSIDEVRSLVNKAHKEGHLRDDEFSRFVFYPLIHDESPNFLGIVEGNETVLTTINVWQPLPDLFTIVDFGQINVLNNGEVLGRTIRVTQFEVPDSVKVLKLNRLLYDFQSVQLNSTLRELSFNDKNVPNSKRTHFTNERMHKVGTVYFKDTASLADFEKLPTLEGLECKTFNYPYQYSAITDGQFKFNVDKIEKVVFNWTKVLQESGLKNPTLVGFQGEVQDAISSNRISYCIDHYAISTNAKVYERSGDKIVPVNNSVVLCVPYRVDFSMMTAITKYSLRDGHLFLDIMQLLKDLNNPINLKDLKVAQCYYPTFDLVTTQLTYLKVPEKYLPLMRMCYLRYFALCSKLKKLPSVAVLKFAKKRGFVQPDVIALLKAIPGASPQYVEFLNKLG